MRSRTLVLPALLAVVALLPSTGCTTSAPPLPASRLGFLLDPRIGFEGKAEPSADKRFAASWTKLSAGFVPDADRSFATIESRYPGYLPASVGRAVVALAQDDVDRAATELDRAIGVQPDYVAARAYRAEVALRRGDVAAAYATYRELASYSGASSAVRQRFETVSGERLRQLLALASGAPSNDEALLLLEEAIGLAPQSDIAREQLARRLVAAKRYADARTQVTSLLDRGRVDDPTVQALLADVEAGEGNFQGAIIRLERLSQRFPGRGYEDRLAAVKNDYKRANLPPRYHNAASSPALTRADLAILSYWEISAFRFAPIADPPIAVDIADVPGREEIVQALGLRLLSVDPITRAVDPARPVTGTAMLRAAALLLRVGGAPPCAGNGGTTAAQALLNCGVPVAPIVTAPDAPLSGEMALAILSAIENARRSAE
ncbi:MAG: tetratricopeptide repeat protein [Acidobacteria bacterium]|nr:tetratricopeptide repeat protein [Acidobacteriota bacterium]